MRPGRRPPSNTGKTRKSLPDSLLVRFVVDVPDSTKNRRWMTQFKDRWKARLEQIDLWMVSYRIDLQ